jgi:flagellar hook-basal body complex protein FliE
MEIKDVTQFPGLVPGIGTLEGGTKSTAATDGGDAGKGSFAAALKSSIAEVNSMQQKADAAITALATGEKASLHETMIAMEQADVSFRLMMQVRNKIVEAYQEILRMQV